MVLAAGAAGSWRGRHLAAGDAVDDRMYYDEAS